LAAKFIPAIAAACLFGCASIHTDRVGLDAVISNPAKYDGQRIAISACINVFIHGVALLPCGERRPNVDIKESREGESDYSRLVSYAHGNMGASPEELPVLVVGRFMASETTGEVLHSITVEQFQPGQAR